MEKAKTYIIVVNYEAWRDTIECLESLCKLSYNNTQIIVIDNSETEESINQIKSWALGTSHKEIPTLHEKIVYPLQSKPINFRIISEKDAESNFYNEAVLIIRAQENRGFSAANNIGLRYAQRRNDFEYCWILNNDTVVEKESLSRQIEDFEKEKKLGILGSKLIEYYSPQKIQAIGGSFNKTVYTSNHIGSGAPITTPKTTFKKIDYVIGASMLVNKNFLDNVGLLNEAYFLYYEELDWTYRTKDKELKIDWCENSLVYHKEGASAGSSMRAKTKSRMSDIRSFESRKFFFKQIRGNKLLFFGSSLLMVINRLLRFQFKTAYMFCKILAK
jgi:GT2 family glycosyltransferase